MLSSPGLILGGSAAAPPPAPTADLSLNPETFAAGTWSDGANSFTEFAPGNTTYNATGLGSAYPALQFGTSGNGWLDGNAASRGLLNNIGWAMFVLAWQFPTNSNYLRAPLYWSQGDSETIARAQIDLGGGNWEPRSIHSRLDSQAVSPARFGTTNGTGSLQVITWIINYAGGTVAIAKDRETLNYQSGTDAGLTSATNSLRVRINLNGSSWAIGRVRGYFEAASPDAPTIAARREELLTYYGK